MKKLLYLLLLTLLLFSLHTSGHSFCLKQQFESALPGDYVVILQDKNFTFLSVYDKQGSLLTLEEVSLPVARLPKEGQAKEGQVWRSWFENGASGSTCWIRSSIDLTSGEFKSSYSFNRKGQIDTSESNHFLAALLNLRFSPLPDKARRLVGSATQKRLWNPPLVIEGRKYPDTSFAAYKAVWPRDHSDLSNRTIIIYLPQPADHLPPFPTYFPYWLEIEGITGSHKLRIVDAGKGARSPQPPLTFPSY